MLNIQKGIFYFSCLLFCSGVAQAQQTIKVGSVTWVGFSGFYVAEDNDNYAKHNTNVRLVNFLENAAMLDAFDKGTVDVALLTYEDVITAVANGKPWRVISTVDYSNGGDAIVARKDIKDIKDLKGKSIGLDFISPASILLDYALIKNEMPADSVKRLNMPVESVQGAMESAQLDAGITYEPNISALTQAGGGNKFHVVYSSKDAPGLITDVLVAKTDYIASHAEELKNLLRGYQDALKIMQDDPKLASRSISPALGVSRSEVKEQLSGVHIPSLEEVLGNFTKSDSINSFYTSSKVISDVLKGKGKIKTIPATEDTFDASIVNAVLGK